MITEKILQDKIVNDLAAKAESSQSKKDTGFAHMYLYNWGVNMPLQRENVLLGVV